MDVAGNEPRLLATSVPLPIQDVNSAVSSNPNQSGIPIVDTSAPGQQIQEAQSGISDAEKAAQKTPVASQTKKLPGIFGIKEDL